MKQLTLSGSSQSALNKNNPEEVKKIISYTSFTMDIMTHIGAKLRSWKVSCEFESEKKNKSVLPTKLKLLLQKKFKKMESHWLKSIESSKTIPKSNLIDFDSETKPILKRKLNVPSLSNKKSKNQKPIGISGVRNSDDDQFRDKDEDTRKCDNKVESSELLLTCFQISTEINALATYLLVTCDTESDSDIKIPPRILQNGNTPPPSIVTKNVIPDIKREILLEKLSPSSNGITSHSVTPLSSFELLERKASYTDDQQSLIFHLPSSADILRQCQASEHLIRYELFITIL
jgi:hypothetical protein